MNANARLNELLKTVKGDNPKYFHKGNLNDVEFKEAAPAEEVKEDKHKKIFTFKKRETVKPEEEVEVTEEVDSVEPELPLE